MLWNESVEADERGMRHLHDSERPWSRARVDDEPDVRTNEASIGSEPLHTKQSFPDEEGYYEARCSTPRAALLRRLRRSTPADSSFARS